MIQVLHRAFGILEIVSSDPDRDWGVGELAKRIGINQTTCSNIVRTLMELGYLEKHRQRRGFRLGPMVYNLSRNGPYMKQLTDTARPAVTTLVRKIRETAVLAVLRNDRKVVLLKIDRDDAYQLRTDFVERQSPSASATGKVLLAYATHGTPIHASNSSDGPDDTTSAERIDEWSLIKINGYSITKDAGGRLVGLGVPIFEARECVAALGVFMPVERYLPPRKDAILDEMKLTADAISEVLSARQDTR